ncbi:serine hydrolase domain-containing protein [Colwellia psychrerythraea]|uniref:Beta-lactamase n=1 Tax=Colwellia psychrerythraea TaxID=28229 RepID=A0A099L1R1_COLPS|nr:serine hydrolase domain-containing protein [Colwellia psychrerythraea]KGJ96057.1 beta-lactamase [Colwellia psychrerythraea]
MKQLNVPGLSIALIHNGKIDWAKGYGIANGTSKVDTNTLFQAGSISKPVAALAALKLVEQGKLQLDVDQYLKDWKVEGDLLTKEKPVTLRQLLTHTGGLSGHGFPGYATGSEIPSTTDVLSGKGNTHEVIVNQIPGSKWR